MSAHQTFRDILPYARRALFYIDARFSVLAKNMTLVMDDSLPHIAATRPDLTLLVNPTKFVEKTTGPGWDHAKQQVAATLILFHEMDHHILGFWARCDRGGFDPMVFNLAQDIVIAEMIERLLPAAASIHDEWGAATCRSFKFPPGKSSEFYYHLLVQNQQDQPNQPDRELSGCAQPQTENSNSESGDDASDEASGSAAQGLPATQVRKLVSEAQEAMKSVRAKTRGIGSIGADIDLELAQIQQPVDWGEVLRECIGYAMTQVRGSTHTNWAMSSRRQCGIGFGYGRPIIPAQVSYAPSVAIVVDTSGSMMDWLDKAAMHAWTAVHHCKRVRVLSCDYRVTADVLVSSQEELRSAIKGGGGTDMKPAFRRLVSDTEQPDVVICITDGDIGSLGDEPDWNHIWLTNNKSFDPAWGQHILVEQQND